MLKDGLYQDALLAQFYDSTSQNRVDFKYCLGLVKAGQSVLDLGCGTGALAVKLAAIGKVTGVEPAAAMLDIAKQRVGEKPVQWVLGAAQNIRLNQKFDLILLTGHSFQVFLTRDDQLAVLKTIAYHLKPEGRFIFDNRNPKFVAPKARDRKQTPQLLTHEEFGQIEMLNESSFDEARQILSYKNSFRIVASGEEYAAQAQILYTPKNLLAELLDEAGLVADEWFGDWEGAAYEASSREIIPHGRLA